MTHYAKKILAFRRKWRMSQERFAWLCGLCTRTIERIECEKYAISPKTLQKIEQAMNSYDGQLLEADDTTPSTDDHIIPHTKGSLIWFEFTAGHCYSINERTYKGQSVYTHIGDYNPVFRYVGKKGIHHHFTHATAGWSRTYTNAQLIGKLILEVKE